jgi:hypothetical protein
MDFRRVEIRRTVRHYERLQSNEDVISTLKKIMDMRVPCSFKVSGYPELGSCYVLAVEPKVSIFSQAQKLKVAFLVADIKEVEVYSNTEVVEEDQKGRWSYI